MQKTNQSKLQSVAPVIRLNSRTMQPTLDFFTAQLGFHVDTVLSSPPMLAMVKRDGLIVMLECRRMIPWKQSGWAIYFWISDAREFRQEIVANSCGAMSEIVEKEYGCIKFKVPLPDKRSLVFGQLLSSD